MASISETIQSLKTQLSELAASYPEDRRFNELTALVEQLALTYIKITESKSSDHLLTRYNEVLSLLEKETDGKEVEKQAILEAAKRVNQALARQFDTINNETQTAFEKAIALVSAQLKYKLSTKEKMIEDTARLRDSGTLEENRQLKEKLKEAEATLKEYKQPFYKWVASGLLEVLKLPLIGFYLLLSWLKKRK